MDERTKILALNYYVGFAGSTGQGGSAATNILAVQDVTDFLDGDFEDLVILNKSGMMNPFGPSLPLVKKARKKLEDKALEKIEDSVK